MDKKDKTYFFFFSSSLRPLRSAFNNPLRPIVKPESFEIFGSFSSRGFSNTLSAKSEIVFFLFPFRLAQL